MGRQSCGKPLESIKVARKEPGATITSLDLFLLRQALIMLLYWSGTFSVDQADPGLTEIYMPVPHVL